jgi:photosystem II stability/assembly factor-like uncharacterized protein
MKRVFLLTLSLLLLFSPLATPVARAQAGPWQPVSGPYGGSVAALALSPNYAVDHTVYAGLRGQGVYRTVDGGDSWRVVGPGNWVVVDLALSPDPADPTLFATAGLWTSGYSVYRSPDGGDSWEDITPAWSALPHPPALAVSPHFATDETLYLLGGLQTYRSTDGGDTFAELGGWFEGREVTDLAFSPAYAADQTLFALVAGEGLYRSVDGGTDWDYCGPAGLSGGLSAFAVSPDLENDGMLVALSAEGGRLYTSGDGGDTWSPGSLILDAAGQHTLLFSPTFADDRILLAASSADPGAYRSDDGGVTWSPVGWYDPEKAYRGGFIGGGIFGLALAPDDAWDARAFAGTSSGIYCSQDRGVHWWQHNDGLARLTVRALASAPGDPGTLLAGTGFFEHLRYDTTTPVESDGNLQLSTDGGQSWVDVSGRLEGVQSVAFSPGFIADGTAFAAAGTLGQHGYADGGIYRSADGGQNWEEVLADRFCQALALHPNYPLTPTVWASASPYTETAFVRSTDGGDTWVPLTPMLNARFIAPSPNYAVDRTFFVGTDGGGLQRSADGELSWTEVLSGPITALAVSPAFGASRTLYAGVKEEGAAPGEVYRSADGGDTWQPSSSGILGTSGGEPRTISALAFAHDGSVLAGVAYGDAEAGAVYRSLDGGNTWHAVGSGLQANDVFALASLPGGAPALLAGVDGGLWQLGLAQGGPTEPGTWTSGGPRGGRAQALAVSPDFVTDGVALAGEWTTERGSGETGLGVFRSVDGGQTWASSSAGTESKMYASALHAFAFSPDFAADRVVFAGTGGGLFKSADGGESWSWAERLYSGPPGSIGGVAVAPNFGESGHVLAASGWGGLYVSRDGGINWTAHLTVAAHSALVYSPDFASDGVAFAGGRSLYRTADGGVTWTEVLTHGVSALAISPDFASDGTLFAASDVLYVSHDAGTGWISVTLPSTSARINALAISPAFGVDRALFAGLNDGLYCSIDGGISWEKVEGYGGSAVSSLAISPGWPAHPLLLAGTARGVYRTVDGGATWALAQGLTALSTGSLAPSAQGDLLLAGAYRHGIYGTTDGGENWTPLGLQEMGSYAVVDAALSPAYPGDRTAFAALASTVSIGAGVYRTADGGTTWELVHSTDSVDAVAISPQYAVDRVVYAAGPEGQVLRSPDGGDTWALVGQWPAASHTAHLVALPPNYPADSTLFAAGGAGFWRLPPGASTWEPAASGLVSNTYVSSIAVSPNYPADRTLLATASWQEPGAGLQYGAFRSSDGGVNWTLASAGLPQGAMRAVAFSPDYLVDRIAYLTAEGGLYRSLDGGLSWTWVGLPPGEPALRDVLVDGRGVRVASDLGVWQYATPLYDIVIDGGFEAQGGWELPETPAPAGPVGRVAYDGLRSLRVGIDDGPNVYSYSSARQAIAVPTAALSATLGCYVYPVSGGSVQAARDQVFPGDTVVPSSDPPDRAAGDAQYLLLLDPEDGAIIEDLFWELSNAQGWQFHTFDLSSYAGRTVELCFGVYNDGAGGQAGIYVDDVSLLVDRLLPEVTPWQFLPLVVKGE